jgi:hypothetical protein
MTTRGWHVLVEKPLALDLRSAQALVERAMELKRHLWVGLVYLFAPYLSVLKPYADGNKNWLLEWHEPAEEIRWGEIKSTPHHVTLVEDIFPHAWSILRGAGLSEPLQVQKLDMISPSSASLELTAGEATVHLMFDRRRFEAERTAIAQVYHASSHRAIRRASEALDVSAIQPLNLAFASAITAPRRCMPNSRAGNNLFRQARIIGAAIGDLRVTE